MRTTSYQWNPTTNHHPGSHKSLPSGSHSAKIAYNTTKRYQDAFPSARLEEAWADYEGSGSISNHSPDSENAWDDYRGAEPLAAANASVNTNQFINKPRGILARVPPYSVKTTLIGNPQEPLFIRETHDMNEVARLVHDWKIKLDDILHCNHLQESSVFDYSREECEVKGPTALKCWKIFKLASNFSGILERTLFAETVIQANRKLTEAELESLKESLRDALQ